MEEINSSSGGSKYIQGSWFKSSASSGNGSCVEVRFAHDLVYIRDSKEQHKPGYVPSRDPLVAVPMAEFESMIDDIRSGNDAPALAAISVTIGAEGCSITSHENGTVLSFTQQEWHAFKTGVERGEFDTVLV